jgi:hypothetical protein
LRSENPSVQLEVKILGPLSFMHARETTWDFFFVWQTEEGVLLLQVDGIWIFQEQHKQRTSSQGSKTIEEKGALVVVSIRMNRNSALHQSRAYRGFLQGGRGVPHRHLLLAYESAWWYAMYLPAGISPQSWL